MKRRILLIAVLWSGELCEAALCLSENVEDAKAAIMVNYHLAAGEVKEWVIR